MKAALYRIFRKNLFLLLAVATIFLGLKYLTVKDAEIWLRDYPYLDGWVMACADLNSEEVDAYVESLTQQISSDTGLLKRTEYDAQEFLNSYHNRKEVQLQISFARTGQGQLPSGIPENFPDVLHFYRELEAPHIINKQPLDLYFAYQAHNIVPILSLILSAIIWGMHFESEIYKYTETTKSGKHYSNTVNMTLMTLGILLVTVNEWFDLWRSGLLARPYLWSSPIQSYTYFSNVQMKCSIGTVLIMNLCSKLLGVLILNHAAWLIAKLYRSLKNTLVCSFLLLIVLLFLGKAIENTDFHPLLQIGIVDWQELIAKNRLLLPLNITALPLGLGITAAAEYVLACCWQHRLRWNS